MNALPTSGLELKFTISELEKAFRMSGLGKRSKQRFLKSSSKDNVIKHARKGAGGNTVPYKCFIIKQSIVSDDVMQLLRKGNFI